MNPKETYEKIVAGTKQYFKDASAEKAVFGLSGGIDSCVTAHVLKDALQGKNVTALLMPEEEVNEKETVEECKEICKELEINFEEIPIDGFLKALQEIPWKQGKVAGMNLKARVRMILLYNFANSHNALVVGTGNKSEILLGYFTKYGDAAADILPLGDIYKTEEYEIAKAIGIPEKIIKKAPSAGLYAGQTDEKELGFTYEQADPILIAKIEEAKKPRALLEEFSPDLAESVLKRVKENEHKRIAPFVVQVR